MSKFTSKKIETKASPEKVFSLLYDLNDLQTIMPDQIENWRSNGEECFFYIKNLGDLGLKKGMVDFPVGIRFDSTVDSKVRFTLSFRFFTENDRNFFGFEIEAEMNPMIEMMARRPLTNFVNILTENLMNKLK